MAGKRKHRMWPAVATLLLFASYPLSYAPYLRWRFGGDIVTGGDVFVHSDSGDHSILMYAPVEFLIDRTPFRPLLIHWAELWGVSGKTWVDSNSRGFADRP